MLGFMGDNLPKRINAFGKSIPKEKPVEERNRRVSISDAFERLHQLKGQRAASGCFGGSVSPLSERIRYGFMVVSQ